MERVQFLKTIYELYESEPSDHLPPSLRRVRAQLTQFQWTFLKGIVQDRKRILDLFPRNVVGKKGGISGASLPPITVAILNRGDLNPAQEKCVGYDNKWLVVYFGISPEVESFVSIVMWPSASASSRLCYSTIYEASDKPDRAIEFEGSYNLRPPNEIRPQMVQKISISADTRPFYDWRYFPFIKDVGDSLWRPLSPINYRLVFLRGARGEIVPDCVTARVIIGSIIELRGDEIKVKVPFLERTPHAFEFRMPLRPSVGPPRKGSLYYFLLLERAGERIPEVFLLEPALRVDALAHMLSFWLYNTFMNKVRSDAYRSYMINRYTAAGKINLREMSDFFGICTLQNFQELFYEYSFEVFDKIYKDVNQKEEDPPRYSLRDTIWNSYLSPYFKLDTNSDVIYYSPPVFHHDLSNRDLLCGKVLEIRKITRRYAK
jgi:hypothetical protein